MTCDSGKRLIIEPICGLSNRLMVLASAQRLAALFDRQLVLLWGNGAPSQAEHSNCRFAELFENDIPQLESYADLDDSSSIRLVSPPRGIPWRHAEVRNAVAFDPERCDLTAYQTVPNVSVTACVPLVDRCDTRAAVIKSSVEFLLSLRPVQRIENAVQRFRRQHFTSPVLGVHIRRGDHGAMLAGAGIAQTTEDDFSAYVERCLSKRQDLRVFHATDDPDVKQRLARRFGDRLHSFPSESLDRATPVGAQSALIDLLLLSYADFICGTPWSTFTRAAAFRNVARRSSYSASGLDLPAGIRDDAAGLEASVGCTLAALDLAAAVRSS